MIITNFEAAHDRTPDVPTEAGRPLLHELLAQLPAVILTGPRASGKTTTARGHATQVIRLDRPTERDAIAADPDAVIRSSSGPLLIDEWQVVPGVLGAVKRSVDDSRSAGRFIAGAVLHTGPRALRLGDRVLALPLWALWSQNDLDVNRLED